MKNIRLRCLSCGRRYVAEGPEGVKALCPACGAALGREGEKAAPGGQGRDPSAVPKAVSARSAPGPPAPPGSRSEASAARPARPGPASRKASEPVSHVICPRCGLHFAPRAAHRETPASERRTVLVVEDMDYFRDIARDALEPRYRVQAAGTVEEAQAALIAGEIDLILLDVTLRDGEDGLKLLRELTFKPCPILIFTAEDESVMHSKSWDKLRRLGADDVVIKGMNVGESILRKVGSLLGDDGTAEDKPV